VGGRIFLFRLMKEEVHSPVKEANLIPRNKGLAAISDEGMLPPLTGV